MMESLPPCETLLLDRQGSRLYVTLNRPESRNALSTEMVAELSAVAMAIAPDRGIRTLILRGAGETFCAGGDIKGFARLLARDASPGERDPVATENRSFGDFLITMGSIPQTTVAVAHGAAFGGGLGLLCVFDLVLCTADTRLALSETGLGIPPAQIAPFVVRRVGLTAARQLALTGMRFQGEHALRIGLANYVVESEAALEPLLNKVLNEIGRCAPGANAATKRILMESMTRPLGEVLDGAAKAFAAQLRGTEGKEGVSAFLERRDANWVEHVE